MSRDSSEYKVCTWLTAAHARFENMYHANLDLQGLPNINKAIEHLQDHGYLTVGQIQYLFDRTHPLGKIPNYNTHRKLNKRYGNMVQCNLNDLIDSNLVDWTTGRYNVIKPNLITAIDKETLWLWSTGNLHKKPLALVDLFV